MLLYPAIQKFYNSLIHLNNFYYDNDFCLNISFLDAFFLEFRNITFVIQKSISNNFEYKKIYDECNSKYLSNCKWFVDMRNIISKEHSIEYEKELIINIYNPSSCYKEIVKKYTINNDKKIDCVLKELKSDFKLNDNEYYFSVNYFYHEINNSENIMIHIIEGVNCMYSFINDLRSKMSINDYREKELLKNTDLYTKIDNLLEKLVVQSETNALDYIYYKMYDKFEKANVCYLGLKGTGTNIKISKDSFMENSIIKSNDLFETFVLLHLVIAKEDLFPTFLISYNDDTIVIKSFQSTLKTTTYRIINDLANDILNNKINQIIFMTTYAISPLTFKNCIIPSNIRTKNSITDVLTFISCDKDLNEKELCIDNVKQLSINDIVYCYKNNIKNHLEFGKYNFNPIVSAFTKLEKQ